MDSGVWKLSSSLKETVNVRRPDPEVVVTSQGRDYGGEFTGDFKIASAYK